MTSTLSLTDVVYGVSRPLGVLPDLLLNDTPADPLPALSVTSDPRHVTEIGEPWDLPQGQAVTERNVSALGPPFHLTVYSQEHLIATSVVLGVMVLCCIIGNCFVIAAVILERSLHHVANYLILSLAVADLMVAVLVMPLSVVAEISQVWFLHSAVCDMWISFDVLCCTASILHLVAIAMDRYWAVTSIDYMRRRTARRILLMILVVWVVALTISIPPLFGWRDPNNDPDLTGVCIISQDHGYTVFSTVGAFYLPMFIMICIYTRIYLVARRRIRKEKFHKKKRNAALTGATTATTGAGLATEQVTLAGTSQPEYSVVSNCNGCSPERQVRVAYGRKNGLKGGLCPNNVKTAISDQSADNDSHEAPTGAEDGPGGLGYTNGVEADPPTTVLLDKVETPGGGGAGGKGCPPSSRHRDKLEQKRERKAARTLAIITGAFLLCWLPFFIVALVGPFIRQSVQIPPIVGSLMLWLGYLNSLLNPVIYTIFSPEFRNAFRKILFGKYSRRRRVR